MTLDGEAPGNGGMNVGEATRITLRGVPHSDALEARIRQKVRKLEQLYPGLLGCRVVAEIPHRHQSRRNQFIVRLDIAVPGGELVVNRDHHEDVYVALREAFRAARRQLGEYTRRLREGGSRHGIRVSAVMGAAVAKD